MLKPNTHHILLVEDNPMDQLAIREILKACDETYELSIASTVAQAKSILEETTFDVVISDYDLEDGTGLEIIRAAKAMPVVMLTGNGNEEIAVKALKAGAYDYYVKDAKHKNINLLPITLKKVIAKKVDSRINRMLLSTLQHVADSVCVTDLNNTIIFANDAFCKEHNNASKNLIGKNLDQLEKKYQLHKEFKEKLEKLHASVNELSYVNAAGKRRYLSRSKTLIDDEHGNPIARAYVARDITRRKQIEQKQKKLLNDLKKALTNVRMLSGLLPICSCCKKIRDDGGDWKALESYIKSHSEADFSHGLCPECASKLYPEFSLNDK
jgi:PAS domain S-box-containing protein